MAEPILRIENVSKRYGKKDVLKGASLNVNKGDLKILIGPSGAGKSTLLQCINFLVKPDEGRIWLDGQEVRYAHKRDLYAYRQKVGMIFQDFNLFDHLNALENVRIGMIKVRGMGKAEASERAVMELERVGLKDHMQKYPAQLSGGQKQRVSIARALAMDPKVMLLDEPTSALDPELIGEVHAVIRDLGNNGMTMIMATHQIGFASSLASEIIFMEDGRILERGSPGKIFNDAENARTREFCSKITELYGGTLTMEEWLYIQNEVYPALLKGFWVSFELILPSSVCGLIIGILIGVLRVYGSRPVMAAANGYVALFRGVPLVVQLFIWYFGLPYIGIYLNPFLASVLGFSLCSGAYHSEYVRGALLSIKRGQMLAAQSLGFNKVQMIFSIILPQAIRRALPGCGNEIIYLIKYSSLAYMITCIELTGQGKILASNSFKYTEIFLIIGACYLVMTSVATLFLGRLEDRLRLPGFEHQRI